MDRQSVGEVYEGDCIQVLGSMPDGIANLAIVDPPYNIGFDYGEGGYVDRLSPEDYLSWTERWLLATQLALHERGTLWVIIGDEYVSEVDVLAKKLGFTKRSHVVWYYTFGVNSAGKFTRSHTHLLYLTKHPKHFEFYPDEVRVPSQRALRYNDKRANPEGRLPDDTWIINPAELPAGFAADSDTWTIPRVCGTFREREAGAANQLPEQLVGRIIRSCTRSGAIVLDPMAGTGTVPATAKKLGRRYLAIEQSPRYAAMTRERVAAATSGDQLDPAAT